jgi:hypothetical protein
MSAEKLKGLNSRLMLFFTGFSRNASEMARTQIENTPGKRAELERMKELLDEAYSCFTSRSDDTSGIGRLLDEQWKVKKMMSDRISTPEIDAIYEAGKNAGASGGKLLGAGGGGFILFYVEPERQASVKAALSKLLHVPFFSSIWAARSYTSNTNRRPAWEGAIVKVSVIVFEINEIDGMKAMMPQIKPEWYYELIVVDGGSTDGTIEYCKSNNIPVFIQEQPGVGGALDDAMKRVTGDVVVIYAPDGSFLADRIPMMVQKIKEGADIVNASRYIGG